MRKRLCMVIGVLLTVVLVIVAFGCAKPALPTKDLRMQSASVGSGTYVISVGMGEIWNKYVAKPSRVNAIVTPYTSITEVFKLLDRGEIQVAWQPGSLAYNISQGVGTFKDYGKRIFYTLFEGGTSTLFIVTTDPNIKSIKDLKGKKVAGKFAGTTTIDDIRGVLFPLYGMTDADVKLITYTSPTEMGQQLKDGVADAGITLTTRISPFIEELAATKTTYFIPLTDQEIAAIAKPYPFWFKNVLPANTYKGQTSGVPTVEHLGGIFVRRDFDEVLAYEMVKQLFDHQKEFSAYHASAVDWTLDIAITGVEAVFHPFSPGAVKYYKEKGIWTSKHETRQQELLKAAGQ